MEGHQTIIEGNIRILVIYFLELYVKEVLCSFIVYHAAISKKLQSQPIIRRILQNCEPLSKKPFLFKINTHYFVTATER